MILTNPSPSTSEIRPQKTAKDLVYISYTPTKLVHDFVDNQRL